MNRKNILILIAVMTIVYAIYLFFKPHKQDPHYFAAACVVLNDMAAPASTADFTEKLRTVIINENASYAVDKVEFDPASAQAAIRHYQHLSETEQRQAKKSIDSCLPVMMPQNSGS
ncbi:hypothetical protein AAGQ96_17800 [Pantoea sp. MBD-2R]|uniref:hypothetical protein n=1 Tax=Pantoea sp. MBD-2R TaxID=3141540 RepID=UPI00318356AA